MEPLLLTPEQAAQQLGIGRSKMYSLISTRTVESVKLGKARRIPTQALAQYVAELRKAGADDAA